MTMRFVRTVSLLLLAGALSSGCVPRRDNGCCPDPCAGHLDISQLDIKYPDACPQPLDDAVATPPPNMLDGDHAPNFHNVTLEQAIQIALANSDVLRDLGGLVLRDPDSARTIYDPAIVTTEPRLGVEGALSEFDASFAARAFFQKNDRALNNIFEGGGTRLFKQDDNRYDFELAKRGAAGTEMALRHIVDYNYNNAPGNNDPNLPWLAYVEGEVRQPLLQGAGVDFNRIAGPRSIPGIYTGVLLARVNSDISLTDFEAGVRDLVGNVEGAYWELYFAYRDLDAKRAARDRALKTWQEIRAYYETGRRGGDADQEAQAREQYFRLDAEVQTALAGRPIEKSNYNVFQGSGGVYTHERRLRRAMGLSATDGDLLRPVTEPPMAHIAFVWDDAVLEALTRRPEIRRQEWKIRKRELEVVAARNFLLPRLDAVARYRFRGLGHDLLDPNRDSLPEFSNAYQNLTGGKFQEWDLGLELTVPIGFRREFAAVRNAELRLARDRAILQEQQREVVNDLSNAVAESERAYRVGQTNYNRRLAASQQLQALEAIYAHADESDKPRLLDLLLDAQQRLADSESRFYRSLSEYAFALKSVHFEKGSLLECNQIYLTEGPWPSKAYYDAARRESLTRPAPLLDYMVRSHPPIVSRGIFPQQTGEPVPAPDAIEPLPATPPGATESPSRLPQPHAT